MPELYTPRPLSLTTSFFFNITRLSQVWNRFPCAHAHADTRPRSVPLVKPARRNCDERCRQRSCALLRLHSIVTSGVTAKPDPSRKFTCQLPAYIKRPPSIVMQSYKDARAYILSNNQSQRLLFLSTLQADSPRCCTDWGRAQALSRLL